MALLVRSWVGAQHPLASVLPKEWALDYTRDFISFFKSDKFAPHKMQENVH